MRFRLDKIVPTPRAVIFLQIRNTGTTGEDLEKKGVILVPMPDCNEMSPDEMDHHSEAAPAAPPRRRKLLKIGLILLLLLPVLLAGTGLLLVKTEAGRRTILDRVARTVAESRVDVDGEDFDLQILAGVLVVDKPSVAASGAQPFLVAERLEVDFNWGDLFETPVLLEALTIDGAVVDLDRPLPSPSDGGDESSPLGVAIPTLRLNNARARGALEAAPEDAPPWLASWTARSVDLRGRLAEEDTELEVEAARIELVRATGDTLLFDASARLHGPLDGPFTLENLLLTAPDTRLEASGTLGLEPDQPLAIRLDLDTEPGKLLDELDPGGHLRARIDLDLRRFEGTADITATDFPADTLEPWIGQAALLGDGSPSYLDVKAHLESDRTASPEVSGTADVTWRQGDRRLLKADVRLLDGRLEESGVALDSLRGQIHARGKDLPIDLLAPWLPLQESAAQDLAGSRLDVKADFTVAGDNLGDPTGRVEILWHRDTSAGRERLVQARAETVEDDTPKLRIDFNTDAFPDLPGRRALRGRLVAPAWDKLEAAEFRDTRLDLVLPDVDATLGDLERRFPRSFAAAGLSADAIPLRPVGTLDARLSLTGQVVDPRLDLDATWRPSEASRLTLDVAGHPQSRRGEARVELENLDLGLLLALEEKTSGRVSGVVTASGTPADWRGTLALDGEDLLYGDTLPRLETLHLEANVADGTLHLDTLRATSDGRRLTATGDADLELPVRRAVLSLELDEEDDRAGDRTVAGLEYLALDVRLGAGTLHLDRLETTGALQGTAGAEIPLEGLRQILAATPHHDLAERLAELPVVRGDGPVHLELDLPDIRLEPILGALEIEAPSIDQLNALVANLLLEPAAEGGLRRAEIVLRAGRPAVGVDALELAATLENGVLQVKRLELDAPSGSGDLTAQIPLGAIETLLPEFDAQSWGVTAADGSILVDLGLPRLDLAALAEDAGVETPWTAHQANITGRFVIDPERPRAAEGELMIHRWLLETEGHRLESDEPFLLALADRHLELLPMQVRIDDRPLDIEAELVLAPDWTFGDEPAKLVQSLLARVDGVLETEILNPFLAGGIAEGPADIHAEVIYTNSELSLDATLDGPEVTLVYPQPYLTRITEPALELTYEDGLWSFRSTRAKLNDGQFLVEGEITDAGDMLFYAKLDGVRYRLDYGLSTVLNGELRLLLPPELTPQNRGILTGQIEVARGLLRRNLNLDREVLGALFGPEELETTEASILDEIDLDLDITTASGVRVRNNLADLRATWSPLSVQGTLSEPVILGRIDVEPDSRLFVYGQTARIDQGGIVFTGEPGMPPQIELETTSTLDDPTLGRGGDQLAFGWDSTTDNQRGGSREIGQTLAQGLAGYYGSQITEQIAGAKVRIEPVLIFGETDPGTSLVLSRDLSPQFAFAVAINLRDSQEQTYLLEIHKLEVLPRFAFQIFTNSETEGVTAQQTRLFGRTGENDDDTRRLRKIRLPDLPEGLPKDKLQKSVVFDPGDPLPEGADFDAEVDVMEKLRSLGYPGARVRFEVDPVSKNRADLVATRIDPGQHVVFEFVGTTPPVAFRRSIVAPYRTDYAEKSSLEEIRANTVRALRGQGYFQPEVTTEVRAGGPDGSRQVTIRGEGGRKVEIERLEFRGTDDDVASFLRSRFEGRLARLELAAGIPGADAWLVKSLRTLGFADPEILGRELSENGKELVVRLAPGPRQRIHEIRFPGADTTDTADTADTERYRERLASDVFKLRPGLPPRADRIAAANLEILNDLKHRGHADARVRSTLEPVAEGSTEMNVLFEVESGPKYQIDDIRFEGLGTTRKKWLRRTVKLEEGDLLDPRELGQSRRLLSGTRLFESVRTVVDHREDGTAGLTFDLQEIPRYRLAYGLRWESEEGGAAVVDVSDRNFLGRGMTLGLRALIADNDRAGRFYAARPGLFGTRASLEFFLEGRREERTDEFDTTTITDTFEGTLQLSYPIARRTTGRVYARMRNERIAAEFFGDVFETTLDTPVLGVQVIYDDRDDPVATTRGLFASADLSSSGDHLSSDFDFTRLFTQASYFRAFGHVIWAQSVRVGLLTSMDMDPLSTELFFAGGEYSVRGYPTDSLAPRETLGDFSRLVGGEALLVINEELRFPVWGDLGGVVFLDAGNAWTDKGDFGSDLFTAAGVGVRAKTPVGLLRLDWAFPLDGREEDPSSKIYIGFGHAF